MAVITGILHGTDHLNIRTRTLTGSLILLCMLVLTVTGIFFKWFSKKFEWFFKIHVLFFVAIFPLALFHGAS